MEVVGGQGVWYLLAWGGGVLALVRWVTLGFVFLLFFFSIMFLF